MQIDWTPQLARHPIDVLQIDKDGARWVDRDPGSSCAAVP
jgi:hypothetical protein